jgi:prepilin-type N-terminal cleavage/methylation domain-containing protein
MSKPLNTAGAFTLVEMLIVITVIGILIGCLYPALSIARQHSRKAAALGMVVNVQAAMDAYLSEQHRLPPTEPDNTLATRQGFNGSPMRALDLLEPEGLPITAQLLSDPGLGYPMKLVDDWSRPISFTADQVVGGVMVKNPPAPVGTMPSDWNGNHRVPFAYLWDLGIPTSHGDVADADPTQNLASWLYIHDTK